ncbi:hypothetical protein ACOSP7_003692 [Xanthoceras sorbifolium]
MEINKMVNNYPVDSNNGTRRGNYIKNWFFQDSSDLESDFRNNMLVVATLIVAVTFQTGINPPGGAWQDTRKGHSHVTPFSIQLVSDSEHAGFQRVHSANSGAPPPQKAIFRSSCGHSLDGGNLCHGGLVTLS